MSSLADTTYVLPIRRTALEADDELPAYLAFLARLMPVIVADGSPPNVFAAHAMSWPSAIVHVPIDADRRDNLNGKVAGVVTGMRRVLTAKAIVADDDVRYDAFTLRRMGDLLDGSEIVRPQNVFEPMPWHAVLDTGRTLIARATGGDWPGTLGIRTETFARAGGYDGDVLFENLELVRTLRAAGAREHVAYDLFVARRPPTTRRYLAQRVRQAFDEFGRPGRLTVQLAIAPALILGGCRFGFWPIAAAAAGSVALAEAGRRRGGGRRSFSFLASALSPMWIAERSVTAWIALGLRIARGGVRYSHGTLGVAAHAEFVLRARFAAQGAAQPQPQAR